MEGLTQGLLVFYENDIDLSFLEEIGNVDRIRFSRR